MSANVLTTKHIGKNIKEIREKKRMTQSDLAKKANLHVSAISHFENSRRRPSIDNYLKLCIALEIGLTYLFETEKTCERNCPDYEGMKILHMKWCDCSCHLNYECSLPPGEHIEECKGNC